FNIPSLAKQDIKNAINAGYIAKCPSSNINYLGWQGVGYIIQDPTTGAGACLISGGAAGAMSLVSEGVYVALFEQFVKGSALVIEGGIEPDKPRVTQTYLAVGAIYRLGYNPILRAIPTVEEFQDQIKKPEYKILYYGGHSSNNVLSLWPWFAHRYITAAQIGEALAFRMSNYLFVFPSGCRTAQSPMSSTWEAKSDSYLGYRGKAPVNAQTIFEEAFWVDNVTYWHSVGESLDFGIWRLKLPWYDMYSPIEGSDTKICPVCTKGEDKVLGRFVITTP
ncbi:MAG: hypothetical protein AB1297_04350, partial [bacterium]